MKDFYENEYVWSVVRKINGGAECGGVTLASALRSTAKDNRYFAARWDIQACQWIKAPEPPAMVTVEMTVEQAEWMASIDCPSSGHMHNISATCRKALDAREAR